MVLYIHTNDRYKKKDIKVENTLIVSGCNRKETDKKRSRIILKRLWCFLDKIFWFIFNTCDWTFWNHIHFFLCNFLLLYNMLIRPNVIFCSGGGLAPLTPITMQDLKPSMFSPILGESPTFNTGTNYIYLPTHKLLNIVFKAGITLRFIIRQINI